MNRQEKLEATLKELSLSSFLTNYQSYARHAEKEKIDHVGYLFQLATHEAEARYNRRTAKLLKKAKLPPGKRLDEFDLSRFTGISQSQVQELAEGSILDFAGNLLIFGPPGTGKTHLAAALGREWCLRGRQTLFTSACALVQELLSAKRDLELNGLLESLSKYQAIIIDDISYIPHDREETDVLFVLLAERYEQQSVVVTSNLPFSQWDQVFKDNMTTTAAIDRLVHHATVLELNGASYRVQVASERKQRRGKQNSSD